LRIEIDNLEVMILPKYDSIAKSHEISFMDHTPDKASIKIWKSMKKTISIQRQGNRNLGFHGVLDYHESKKTLTFAQLQELTALAHQNHITVAPMMMILLTN
jgi:alpha-D-ribose 1-methylphosphonate 5-triphosphate diphosphatase PhnM